jgi:hypothetical protein
MLQTEYEHHSYTDTFLQTLPTLHKILIELTVMHSEICWLFIESCQ